MATLILGIVFLSSLTAASAQCELGDAPINYTSWTGKIQSPGFDVGIYPSDQHCVWHIRVSSGSKVKVTLTEMHLEAGIFRNGKPGEGRQQTCTADSLKIAEEGNVLYEGCGKRSNFGVKVSKSNEVVITFVSDESGEERGFSLQYTGIPGDDITEDTVIETPGYPDYPPHDEVFRWTLVSSATAPTTIRGEAINDSLPFCEESPYRVIDLVDERNSKELCMENYLAYSENDLTLVYNASAGYAPWAGRLHVTHEPAKSCHDFCDNSTGNLLECLEPKMLISNANDYRCICQEDFAGRNCEAERRLVEPCYSGPCYNDGTCSELNHSYSCDCKTGFSGKQCEREIDVCLPTSCQNGGTCSSNAGVITCACVPGYSGKTCETDIHECLKNPCENGGTCHDNVGDFSCACATGFEGKRCESAVDNCASGPCKNGGTCLNELSGFACLCVSGFVGKRCDNKIDQCSSQPCKNGGTCADATGGFACACSPGYSGQMCEKIIDHCVTKPCQNGGTCENQPDDFSCACLVGFKGKRCETFDVCHKIPCLNGGTCEPDESRDFRCTCTEDYTGRICSIPKGAAHCLQAEDEEFGSRLLWEDILADQEDVQPCPPGIIGNGTRKCVHDASSPTKGRWTRPDLGECVSPAVLGIFEMATSLESSEVVSAEAIVNVTSRLANATSVVRDPHGARLYPGDLVFACGIAGQVATMVAQVDDLGDQMEPLAEMYGEVVDNVVDPEAVIIWKNTKTSMVGQKVTSLMASTEMLAANIIQQEMRRRRRRAVRQSSQGDHATFTVTTPYVEFQVQSTHSNQNVTRLPGYSGASASSCIELPGSIADIASTENPDVGVNIYYAKFTSVASLLSLKEDRHNGSEPVTTGVVNSDILSARVLGHPENKFQTLDQPIILTFKLKDTDLKKNNSEYCVFMNMSAESDDYRWPRTGCELYDSNESHVTCYCYHLTNFALLMDVYGTSANVDEPNNLALSYISYIGGCLSILGCLATIIVFEYFRLRSDRVRIHQQLAACIICVQAVFLIGFSRTKTGKDGTSNTPDWACKTVAILLHYFLTAMFCWMLVEGIHLYVVLVRVFKRGSHLKKYVAIGWGVPVVIVGISVGVFYQDYGSGTYCWLNNAMLLVSFVPTVGLVVIINSVILGIVLRVMMKSLNSSAKVTSTKEEKSGLKMSLKAAAVLLPLLGLTWTLGFLAVDTPGGSKVLGYIFTYLFTICNSFQGVVLFIFHCLLNVDVHTAYERRYKRKKRLSTQTSHDTTTMKNRKSSEFEHYMVEPSTLKTSINTTFSDLAFIGDRKHSPYVDSPLRLDRPYSREYSDHRSTYIDGNLSLDRNRPPRYDDGKSEGHIYLDGQPSNGYDDYNMSDTQTIWRRHSLGHEDTRDDSFPRHFRTISTFNPDFSHNGSAFEGRSLPRPRTSSVRFD